jgi:hypothetical protein
VVEELDNEPVGVPSQPTGPQTPVLEDTPDRAVRSLRAAVLTSAIANLVAGYLGFFGTCFGVVIFAPMVVLAAFELLLFLQAPSMATSALERRARVIGVFEILLGVFNLVSLLCGVVTLLEVGKLRERAGSEVPPGT